MKTTYLYGFMGCGKSYIGRKAAEELDLSFIDLDDCIENIPEIFALHGEKHFRELEFNALKEANADIISLGGGALTNPDAAAYAKENAVVIFIDTDFEVCYERIKGDKNRPLAASKTKEELLALYSSRIEHYRNVADYIIKGEEECISLMRKLKQ